MHFLKSQPRSLSPEDYLQKFKKPHSEISKKGNAENDLKDHATLEEILSKGYNDTEESLKIKEGIVEELTHIVNSWVNEHSVQTEMGSMKVAIGKSKNTRSADRKATRDLSQANVEEILESKSQGRQHKDNAENSDEVLEEDTQEEHYGLKIFGSYSLKANRFDGDIDMVVVVPDYFTREKHFFGMLAERFRKNKNITEVLTIPDALVPLIRLTMHEIQIDLLMSKISLGYLLQHPDFFQSMERSQLPDKELRSINGYRTSVYLRNKIQKFDNFRDALKAVKMWAKNKGIYSQLYGYLGGAAYSIMLAKIVQLYPNYSPLALLDRFFFIYSQWVWTISVKIEEVPEEDTSEGAIAIYTPLQPHMNSAHYISKIAHNITRKHLKEAAKVIQEINKGEKTWKDLFTHADFFSSYLSFLEISVMGQNKEDFIPWRGNIESKLRKFIQILEMHHQLIQGIEVTPYPKSFPSHHKDYKFCNRFYIGFSQAINSQTNEYLEIDSTQPVRNFVQLLESYSGISKAPEIINIGFSYINRENIPQDVVSSMKIFE